MRKRLIKHFCRLYTDESGQIIVFVCVFMIAILVFALSVMNIGHITNEKIKLQNAADFAALSAATWQARAMNMEGLLNTTITADIVLQVARSLVTGVAPADMPPDWIQIQQSAQDWIQQSFNKFVYIDQFGNEKEGFGAWMAGLIGHINGGFKTDTQPERVPLYVYRYRFFDNKGRVNPVVGEANFIERAPQYIPAEAPKSNPYYESHDVFAQDKPNPPDNLGYVVWEHKMTLGSKNNIIWPTATDQVRLYSGGDDTTKNGLKYDLLKDLELDPAKQADFINRLRAAINDLVDKFGETDEPGNSSSIVNIIKAYVEKNLTNLTPDDPRFRQLFVYPPAEPIALKFEDGKIYKENSSTVSADSIGQLVIRILPSVDIGVFPQKAGADLIHGYRDYKKNLSDGTKTISELIHNGDRYYDQIEDKEFFTPRNVYACNGCNHILYDKTSGKIVNLGCGNGRHTETRYQPSKKGPIPYPVTVPDKRAKCNLCGKTSTSYWSSCPSGETGASSIGTAKNCSPYYTDKTENYNYQERCWWYYAFGVEFKVTVRAYMNLDFSTIVMGKCSSSTDMKQLERPGNEDVKKAFEDYYKGRELKRNLYVKGYRSPQDIQFGKSFFAKKYDKLPPDLSEYRNDLEAGTVPLMTAYSSARHELRPNSEDIADSGVDLFFGMDWFSVPTSPVDIDFVQLFK